jgi:hypothetical protein
MMEFISILGGLLLGLVPVVLGAYFIAWVVNKHIDKR